MLTVPSQCQQGRDHDEGGDDIMGPDRRDAELLSLKKNQALTLNHQLTQSSSISQAKSSELTDKMKYSQACLLKKQMDISINKLAMTVMGLGVTDEARKRLVVTHVSTIHFTRWITRLIVMKGKHGVTRCRQV